MKVTVHDKQERKYPYAGQFEDETVVLFFSPDTGVIITDPTGTYTVGHHADHWVEAGATPVNVTIEV